MTQGTQHYGAADIIGELEILTQVWISFKHQQTIRWQKNFFISLFIASILYWFYPNIIWVWGMVLGFSAFSLLIFSKIHSIAKKKLKQTYQQIERLKKLEKRYVNKHSYEV